VPIAAPTAGQAFAVATRVMRTRAESEQVRAAMRSLLAAVPGLQVDLVPAGDDWRVVALPFTQRTEAEKARQLLAKRGMSVQLIDF
jgi:hypothetical protein